MLLTVYEGVEAGRCIRDRTPQELGTAEAPHQSQLAGLLALEPRTDGFKGH